jgi:hypothetical protein
MIRRRRGRAHPKTRYEIGVELRRNQQQLGSLVIAIDLALRNLNHRIERAIEHCQPKSPGSVIGSEVQISVINPRHETAFEWLDSVKQSVEELIADAP